MAKMWAGRTAGITDSTADDFNSSIRFDSRMYRQDITGSMAHAAMLGAKNIITPEEATCLIDGLQSVLDDLESGALCVDPAAEDIHMFVEQVLTERLGDVGKKLHTARSRNDQVALDLRMYLMGEIGELKQRIRALLAELLKKAEAHKTTILPGYTHLQRAQPITFAHHLLAYADLPPQREVSQGSGGHKAEASDLDHDQNDALPKRRPQGIGVAHYQTRYTGGGGGSEQRRQEAGGFPGAGGRRKRQQQRSQQDDSKERQSHDPADADGPAGFESFPAGRVSKHAVPFFPGKYTPEVRQMARERKPG